MKQIVQHMRTGKMSMLDAPAPQLGKGELLISTHTSLISAGTERMLIDFANKSLVGKAKERPDLAKKVIDKLQRDGITATLNSVFAQLDEPLPLGYSASGEVIAVGEDLKTVYNIGDRVSMAGAGIANHAEINAVPKNLVAKIPENVSYEDASFATLVAIAMQGFRNSQAGLGDRVLVMGLGLVGQLTVQLASAAGCRVFAVDYDAERVSIASQNGAEKVHLLSAGDSDAIVADFTNGNGFDSIIICAATDSNSPIEQAAAWARDRARIVLTGKTGTTIPYGDYMKKELQFVISRSYGPGRYDKNYEQKGQDYPIGWVRWTERENLQEALNLMADGALNIEALISHQFKIEDYEEAYSLVSGRKVPCLGVLLSYERPAEDRMPTKVALHPIEVVEGDVGLSFIGAGGFARSVLLPTFKKIEHVKMMGILTKGGATAVSTGTKFGFAFAAGEVKEIWHSDNTKAIVIATQHSSHAELVEGALKAGKNVFVEKPLAMNEDELDSVQKAYENSNQLLMVGFNRRFSPYVQAMLDSFDKVSSPRQVFIRVNAGKLPDDNWQNDKSIGGGRLLGEVCHFIDLALCLCGKDVPSEVYTTGGAGQDVYNIAIKFHNGSVANIAYTSEGDASFSKERVEIYGGGQVGIIDNFQSAFVINGGKKRKFKLKNGLLGLGIGGASQDKGHYNELLSFVDAIRGKGEIGITPHEIFTTTRTTLRAAQSLKENKPIKLR